MEALVFFPSFFFTSFARPSCIVRLARLSCAYVRPLFHSSCREGGQYRIGNGPGAASGNPCTNSRVVRPMSTYRPRTSGYRQIPGPRPPPPQPPEFCPTDARGRKQEAVHPSRGPRSKSFSVPPLPFPTAEGCKMPADRPFMMSQRGASFWAVSRGVDTNTGEPSRSKPTTGVQSDMSLPPLSPELPFTRLQRPPTAERREREKQVWSFMSVSYERGLDIPASLSQPPSPTPLEDFLDRGTIVLINLGRVTLSENGFGTRVGWACLESNLRPCPNSGCSTDRWDFGHVSWGLGQVFSRCGMSPACAEKPLPNARITVAARQPADRRNVLSSPGAYLYRRRMGGYLASLPEEDPVYRYTLIFAARW
ncbi:uncharacterized protein LY79DRAFT_326260 [Colletotrichum navitas]|uniref:Uncharacterized protein n=1 Tax=Colletotrichum navitas TaxID=681940 RepID=A0AAD8Q8J4_9PEZI|nr:uncharacterized protein LY79DRAFT_326260 [Colletotrichum navitas]KAK1598021.1 hypothetical protein LY79DRAFT_326260 [Colletotrichum navitas]